MINFTELKPEERQLFADFLLKERQRHESDIKNIDADLLFIKQVYGINPRDIFCSWIEVKG
jgi:hypothetical protein